MNQLLSEKDLVEVNDSSAVSVSVWFRCVRVSVMVTFWVCVDVKVGPFRRPDFVDVFVSDMDSASVTVLLSHTDFETVWFFVLVGSLVRDFVGEAVDVGVWLSVLEGEFVIEIVRDFEGDPAPKPKDPESETDFDREALRESSSLLDVVVLYDPLALTSLVLDRDIVDEKGSDMVCVVVGEALELTVRECVNDADTSSVALLTLIDSSEVEDTETDPVLE